MRSLSDYLRSLVACKPAIRWASPYGTDDALAWSECLNGEWMLWIIARHNNSQPWSEERKALTACCLECAETVRHHWPVAHRKSIDRNVTILKAWARGEAVSSIKAEMASLKLRELCEHFSDSQEECAERYALFSLDYATVSAIAEDFERKRSVDVSFTASRAARARECELHSALNAVEESLRETAAIVRKYFPIPPKRKENPCVL